MKTLLAPPTHWVAYLLYISLFVTSTTISSIAQISISQKQDIQESNEDDGTVTIGVESNACSSTTCILRLEAVEGGCAPPEQAFSVEDGVTFPHTFTGLCAGTYQVVVYNERFQCEYYGPSVTIKDCSTPPSITNHNTVFPVCSDNDAVVSLSIEGKNPPYTLEWSDGAMTSSTGLFAIRTGLAAGEHTVTLIDNCGTQSEGYTINIEEYEPLRIASSYIVVSCPSSISLVVEGGGGNYNIQWSNGETGTEITDLLQGIYTVTITDSDCYEQITAQYPIGSNNVPVQIIEESFVEQCPGAINVSVEVETETFDFAWSDGSTDLVRTDLLQGEYTLTVTDECGSEETRTWTIEGAEIVVNDVTAPCDDGTGSIDISISSGASSYTYGWSGPNGFTSQQEDISVTEIGTYTVVVTNSEGCSSMLPVVVECLPLSVVLNSVAPCDGMSNGQIEAIVEGGGVPYSYSWSNGGNTSIITDLIVDSYTVTVTDAVGVQVVESIDLADDNSTVAFQAEIIFTTDRNECFTLQDIRVTAEAIVSGGVEPYSYEWYRGGRQGMQGFLSNQMVAVEDLDVFSDLRIYVLYVTDARGCSIEIHSELPSPDRIISNEFPLLIYSLENYEHPCANGKGAIKFFPSRLNLVGEAFLSSSFPIQVTLIGSGGYVQTKSITNRSTSVEFTNLPDEVYEVTYEDANGCINNCVSEYYCDQSGACFIPTPSCGKILFDEITTPLSIIASPELACPNQANGTINISVPNAAGNLEFEWFYAGYEDIISTNQNLEYAYAGTYTLKVKEICADGEEIRNEEITITLEESIPPPSELRHRLIIEDCEVIGIDIIGTGSIRGTYIWILPNGNSADIVPYYDLDLGSDYVQSSGNYILSINDGCHEYPYPVSVPVSDNIIDIALEKSNDFPDNNTGTFRGNIETTVSGGTPPYSYSWSNDATTDAILGVYPGTYCVEVTDANGCKNEACATITPCRPEPWFSQLTVEDLSSLNASDGAIHLQINANHSYPIHLNINGYSSNGWTTSLETTSDNISFTGLSSGDYFITLTDGCLVREVQARITDCTTYNYQLELVKEDFCVKNAIELIENGSVTAIVNGNTFGAITYNWDRPEWIITKNENTDQNEVPGGNFIVGLTVMDLSMCESSPEVVVLENAFEIVRLDPATGECGTREFCKGELVRENVRTVREEIVATAEICELRKFCGNDPRLEAFETIQGVLIPDFECAVSENSRTNEFTYRQVCRLLGFDHPAEDLVIENRPPDREGCIIEEVCSECETCDCDNEACLDCPECDCEEEEEEECPECDPENCDCDNQACIDCPSCECEDTRTPTSCEEYARSHDCKWVKVCKYDTRPFTVTTVIDEESQYTYQDVERIVGGTRGEYCYCVTEKYCKYFPGHSLESVDCVHTPEWYICDDFTDNDCDDALIVIVDNDNFSTISNERINDYSSGSLNPISSSNYFPPQLFSYDLAREINGVMADNFGNTYTTGAVPYPGNNSAIETAKRTSFGDIAWSIYQYSNSANTRGNDIAYSRSDNSIIIAGQFEQDLQTGGANNLTPFGEADAVISKFNQNGQEQWSKQMGSAQADVALSTTSSSQGDTYVTGYIGGPSTFDNLSVAVPTGQQSMFVAKYSASGEAIWTRTGSSMGGEDFENSILTIDSENNIIVAGQYKGTFRLQGSSSPMANISSNGEGVFVAKYSSEGSVLWTNKVVNSNDMDLAAVLVDEQDNIMIAGHFSGVGRFNSGELLVSEGGTDLFFSQFNKSGDLISNRQEGGSTDDYIYDAATDGKGNYIYVGAAENEDGELECNSDTLNCDLMLEFEMISCNGFGSIDVTISGGTEPFVYLWSNGAVTEDLEDVTPGTYNFDIIDATGCQKTISVEIPDESTITIEFVAEQATSGEADGSITSTITGGSNPYIYEWSDIGIGEANRNGLSVGTYTVTVTDANGCSAEETIEIEESGCTATLDILSTPICDGETLAILAASIDGGGSVVYTYLWSTGSDDTGSELNVIEAGIYSVTATGNNECVYEQSIEVIASSEILNLDIDGTDPSNSDSNDGSASVSVDGGITPYTYAWSNGGSTSEISDLDEGSYTVTVTSVDGCTATASISLGESGTSETVGIAEGSTYFIGRFTKKVYVKDQILESYGDEDIVFGKYDDDDNLLWLHQAGSLGSDRGTGIASNDNSCVITGYFNNNAQFGEQILTTPNSRNEDAFVARYSEQGELLWINTIGGGTNAVRAHSVSFDSEDNIIVVGFFRSTIYFNESVSLSTQNGNIFNNIFIAKYDIDGNLLWAEKINGVHSSRAEEVTVDSENNIIVAGLFKKNITFRSVDGRGDRTFTSMVSPNAEYEYDVFIAKFSPKGDFLSATAGIGFGDDWVRGLASDEDDNIYFTGDFKQHILFGEKVSLISQGDSDGYLAKFNTNLQVQWVQPIGTGIGRLMSNDVTVDSCGYPIITGNYWKQTGFGELSISNHNLSYSDIFLAKYNPDGQVLWARGEGGFSNDYSTCLSHNKAGVAKYGGCVFAEAQIAGRTIIPRADADMILAQFHENQCDVSNTTNASQQEFVVIDNVIDKSSLNARPNPFSDKLEIDFTSNTNQVASIRIMDLMGRSLYQKELNLDEGINTTQVDLATKNLQDGIYYILLTESSGRVHSHKVVHFDAY